MLDEHALHFFALLSWNHMLDVCYKWIISLRSMVMFLRSDKFQFQGYFNYYYYNCLRPGFWMGYWMRWEMELSWQIGNDEHVIGILLNLMNLIRIMGKYWIKFSL